jgi:hypothetical protein
MELGLQRDYLLGQHRSDVTNERSFRDVRNLRGDVCFCVQQPTLDAPEPPNYLPDARRPQVEALSRPLDLDRTRTQSRLGLPP